jgi:hypothetical protein
VTTTAALDARATASAAEHFDVLIVGARRVTPQLRLEDAGMPILSWIDPENFDPNYLMRSMHLLPQRGDEPEWMHTQDYWTEKDALPPPTSTTGVCVTSEPQSMESSMEPSGRRSGGNQHVQRDFMQSHHVVLI